MRGPLQLFTTLLVCATAIAQAPKQTSDQPVANSGMTITVNTQLVQVDVVVHDANGRAVHGLKPSDFQLAEDKKTQTLRNFEEHVAVDPVHAKPPAVVKLGPGIFTDYSPVPENAPLTVILVDRLNTPISGQTYVLQQLRKFVENADPHSRVAIFGLTSRLIMLQGFTSDPAVLRNAIDHKINVQSSDILPPSGDQKMSDSMEETGAPASLVADLRQFEAEAVSYQKQLGINLTLTAFNQLAGYLAGFPGRKNLLWLSGSFPISIDPDTSIQYSFNTEANFTDAFNKMTALLAYARVAVYPVDANGLEPTSPFTPSYVGRAAVTSDARSQVQQIRTAGDETNALHQTMNNLADETGGQAFYNSNDLTGAFAQALAAGSDYYTLTYSPTNHDDRGGFRTIRVQLEGAAGSRGLKVFYRRGYYLESSSHRKKQTESLSSKTENATTPAPDPYALAVMQHGAPAPSEILFKVRVLRAEDSAAETPGARSTVPSSLPRYEIDFTTLVTKIDIPLESDGHHHGAAEFVTFIYDRDGKLLDTKSETMHFNLTPENYDKLLKGGIGYSQQVTPPAKAQSLRIAVHDLVSGRLGVVEVPLASVPHATPAS